jgi:hypothetical protein
MAAAAGVSALLVGFGASQADVYALIGGTGLLAAVWAWRQ